MSDRMDASSLGSRVHWFIPAGIAVLLVWAWVGTPTLRGDEPSWLGRIFRRAEGSAASRRVDAASNREGLPTSKEADASTRGADSLPAVVSEPHPGERIGAPANADPLISRFSIGRATDGTTFGMFLHVFADGTVMDSAGMHHADPRALETLRGVITETPVERLSGHCEGTAADYLEVVYLVVYQRAGGKLRAQTLSYAGNTTSCDPSIQRLQATLEAFQAHLTPGIATAPAVVGGLTPRMILPAGNPYAGVSSAPAPSPQPYSVRSPVVSGNPEGPAGVSMPGPAINPAPPPPLVNP